MTTKIQKTKAKRRKRKNNFDYEMDEGKPQRKKQNYKRNIKYKQQLFDERGDYHSTETL